MAFWQEVEQSLSATLGSRVRLDVPSAVGGGSINQAFRVESNKGPFFAKVNTADGLDMFAAEAEGLEELQQSVSLRVPNPLAWGSQGNRLFWCSNTWSWVIPDHRPRWEKVWQRCIGSLPTSLAGTVTIPSVQPSKKTGMKQTG